MILDASEDLIDRAEIVAGQVIVTYSKTEAALADLRQRFGNVVFDMATTKGEKEARSARQELVKLRTSLEDQRKVFKSPALELGRKIDAEAARVTAEIKAVETPIDQQIKADETRRAAEKAERERIEAERITAHQTRIAAIRACVGRAQGLPSERIAKGIAQVEAIVLGVTAWEEFAAEAGAAKVETLASMRSMFYAAKAREDEGARVEAQRVENERIAAENRAAAERLAEQQRAIDARAAALKAEEAAAEERRAEEAARLQREADARARAEAEAASKAQEVITVAATPAPVLSEKSVADQNAREFVARVEAKGAEAEKPTLKLGEINARLGFTVSAEFLAELGYQAHTERSAKLYRESLFPAICDAIRTHTVEVRERYAYSAVA